MISLPLLGDPPPPSHDLVRLSIELAPLGAFLPLGEFSNRPEKCSRLASSKSCDDGFDHSQISVSVDHGQATRPAPLMAHRAARGALPRSSDQKALTSTITPALICKLLPPWALQNQKELRASSDAALPLQGSRQLRIVSAG